MVENFDCVGGIGAWNYPLQTCTWKGRIEKNLAYPASHKLVWLKSIMTLSQGIFFFIKNDEPAMHILVRFWEAEPNIFSGSA